MSDRDPVWDPSEGPFDEKPSHNPPRSNGAHPPHWEQASDGKWYAFYGVMGPNARYSYEHPYDVHWWADHPDVDPGATGPGTWACRHGHWAGNMILEPCLNHPDKPISFVPPTDEEIEAATEGLAALLASMESNTR